MKLQITDRTEMMFSQAVALAQSGKMKSGIHALGKDLYILNMDDTILMHFLMDQKFPGAVSFFANDYESPSVEIDQGAITFITNRSGYEQRKSCQQPKLDFEGVTGIWRRFFPVTTDYPMMISKAAAGLLDDSLSHVEIHGKDNQIKLIQKNIYSGSRVEVFESGASESLLSMHVVPENMQPIGIRTNDFQALFSFAESITFYIQPGHNYVYFKDSANLFEGILATCVYDELGLIAHAE